MYIYKPYLTIKIIVHFWLERNYMQWYNHTRMLMLFELDHSILQDLISYDDFVLSQTFISFPVASSLALKEST